MERSVRKLVFGLGNPGPEYLGTRHNVGYEVVDLLAHRAGLLFGAPNTLEGFTGRVPFRVARDVEHRALLVKPGAFMNRSGEVVSPLARFTGCAPEEVFVVHDDIDLPLGSLRIRAQGGHGGHNGMRSILTSLGTDRFPRLRVGIGRSSTDAARHVLARFDEGEREEIAISVAEAADAVSAWIAGLDLDALMTRFHSRWNQATPD
jgi:PTH1 family peptidyl-tRNA hydrolase